MPDRITEIRARLNNLSWVSDEFIAHAPADIAWLLRRLDFETRLVADLEAQLDRAHERYAAEVERLRSPLHVIDPKTGQRYTVERPPHDPKKKRCRCLACNRAEVAP